jgi:hypothetical protein
MRTIPIPLRERLCTKLKSTTENTLFTQYVAEVFSPDFWDSPPMCFNLRDASNGFRILSRTFNTPANRSYGKAICAAISEVSAELDIVTATGLHSFKIQSYTSASLNHNLFATNWSQLFKTKLSTSFPKFTFEISEVEFDPLFEILKPLGSSIVVPICRLWLVAWATSHRMHEASPQPCIFGCAGCPDRMSHYSFGFPFWRALSESSPCPGCLADDPFSRLGLEPDLPSLISVGVATHLYHAARHALNGRSAIPQPQLLELARVSWTTAPSFNYRSQ